MAARRPSAEESALWRAAMRDVRAHRGTGVLPAVAAPDAITVNATPEAAAAPVRARGGAAAPPGAGLDRRSAQRLKRGQMRIEARLDLHGMTQAEAHGALIRFLARAHDAGYRAVLVVTGKGTRENVGVLRRAVPRWLNEPAARALVLAVTEAQLKDGGSGALYVLLRRQR